jgi:O-antigen/teichoic acid export membrane protein
MRRPYLRRVVVGSLATTAGNAWTIVLGVMTVPPLLHGLGAESFGIWSLLQACSGTTGLLSIASVAHTLPTTRLVAASGTDRSTDDVRDIARTELFCSLAAGLVLALAFASLGRPALSGLLGGSPESLGAVVVWFALYLLSEQVALGAQAVLEGAQRLDLSRAADALRRTTYLGTACIVALRTEDLLATVAISAVVASVVSAGITTGLVRSRFGSAGRARKAIAMEIVRSAGAVIALNAVGVLHRTMDRFLAAALFGSTAVALVEVATQLQSAVSAVLAASAYTALTSAPWLDARGARDQQKALLLRGSRYVLLATVPVGLYVSFVADPLLDVWLGDEVQAAAGLVPIAVAYVLVAAPFQVGSNMLLGMGKASQVLRAAAPAVVLNLAASVVLSEAFGLAGLFWGSLVGNAILLPMLGSAIKRIVDVDLATALRDVFAPVAPAAAALIGSLAIVMLAGPDTPWITLVAAAAVSLPLYVAIAARWGFRPGEIRELVGALRARE